MGLWGPVACSINGLMIVMIFNGLSEIEFLVTGGSARLATGTGRWPFVMVAKVPFHRKSCRLDRYIYVPGKENEVLTRTCVLRGQQEQTCI